MSFFGCLVIALEKVAEYVFFTYVWPRLEKFLKSLLRKGIRLLVRYTVPRIAERLEAMLKAFVGRQDTRLA